MTELMKVLMERDELSMAEAAERIKELKQQVANGEDPEDVLYDIELEPDYSLDLL